MNGETGRALVDHLRQSTRILDGEIVLPQAALMGQIEMNLEALDAYDAGGFVVVARSDLERVVACLDAAATWNEGVLSGSSERSLSALRSVLSGSNVPRGEAL